jgi:uncharacterized protein (DUF2384 family)
MTSRALIEMGVLEEERTLSDARLQVAELAGRYGLTDSEIAKATDASPRTVARWREQTGPQRASRYDERIEQLIEIAHALEEVLPDAQSVRTYLISRNRYLDGARPVNLLGAGRYREVREAIARRRAHDPLPADKRAKRRGRAVRAEGEDAEPSEAVAVS